MGLSAVTRFRPFLLSGLCGRWVSRGCDVGTTAETPFSRVDRVVTCGFTAGFRFAEAEAPVFGFAGAGAAAFGPRSGRFLRALVLILRVRRAPFSTSWAVASAHRRWICGR